MKKVLITGISGFLGKAVVERIQKMDGIEIYFLSSKLMDGSKCIVYDMDSFGRFHFNSERFKELEVDYFDVVIHIGAFVPITKSDQYDYEKNMSTVQNTTYLLEHLPGRTKRVVLISSISVYETKVNECGLIREDSKLKPDSLYAKAKFECEQVVTNWARSFDCEYCILRISNVYGPGDHRDNSLISVWVNNAIHGKDLEITLNENEIRNYIYIDDAVEKICFNAFLPENRHYVNIISENVTLRRIAEAVILAISGIIGIRCSGNNLEAKRLLYASYYDDYDFPSVSIENGINEYVKGLCVKK